MGAALEPGAIDPLGNATATLRLPAPDAVRPVLAAVNAAVDIREFSPRIASMDDIFVRAVREANQE